MEGVLKNAMHATDGKPSDVKKGDIILISQTKNTLKKDEKHDVAGKFLNIQR